LEKKSERRGEEVTVWEDILYPIALISGWSLIYKDNPFWRVFENALVGLGTAITFKLAVDTINGQNIQPVLKGTLYPSLVGLILGILVLSRLVTSIKEYSYIPFALMAGVGAAVGALGAVGPQIVQQTILPSFVTGDPWKNINSFILFLATLMTMSYFIFSVKKGKVSGPFFKGIALLGKGGRYLMMIAFGVSLSTFYITTGTEMIVYADYLFSPIGRWITLAGVVILAVAVAYPYMKRKEASTR
jgi:hypothetical protein